MKDTELWSNFGLRKEYSILGVKNIHKLNENKKKENGVTCPVQVVFFINVWFLLFFLVWELLEGRH